MSLNGFEDITGELNDQEKQVILPILVKHLPNKKGKERAVTSKQIIQGLANGGIKTSGPRIRKMINYIRTHHLVPKLIATSKGYYVANTQAEVDEYIESLRQRENAIRAVRESFYQETLGL